MTDDPLQSFKRCTEGHDLFMTWINAFMVGSKDTKHLRENYNQHVESCPMCRKADKPKPEPRME